MAASSQKNKTYHMKKQLQAGYVGFEPMLRWQHFGASENMFWRRASAEYYVVVECFAVSTDTRGASVGAMLWFLLIRLPELLLFVSKYLYFLSFA